MIDISDVQRAEDVFTDAFFDDPYPTYAASAPWTRPRLPFDLKLEQAQTVAGASTTPGW